MRPGRGPDTVHALLRHVRAQGIDWVPEPRGRDAALYEADARYVRGRG